MLDQLRSPAPIEGFPAINSLDSMFNPLLLFFDLPAQHFLLSLLDLAFQMIMVITSTSMVKDLDLATFKLQLRIRDADGKCRGLSLKTLSTDFLFPALPVLFKEELKNEEVQEGASVTLRCELTKAAPVLWKIGSQVLKASDKYQMRQPGTTAELVIHDLEVKDAGDYTCVCGDQKTTATLTVHGKKTLLKLGNSSVARHHS